ncbi:hypothetical protein AJ80_02004 [Polytolypa hystricis UAMH7299]|uniref:Uncharacterized protein n=1 Tax=Polytolypa hystricis (strain UAMH7299) TaxID=1447883 RepID=A0A2B7YSU5_POLH7|nr:hypothetical protein AJ80_02004 [Polytolypa hystricis UAMH7299]
METKRGSGQDSTGQRTWRRSQQSQAINTNINLPQKKSYVKGFNGFKDPFSLEPRWTIEPDLESIKRMIDEDGQSQEIIVSFLAQRAFNKIYDIRTGNQALIMRVTSPVDPQYKTLSEVATVDWMRRYTSLPVPGIIAHQVSRGNAIGFEWILMKKIPGKSMADAWETIQYSVKGQFVQQLATYSSSLFKN